DEFRLRCRLEEPDLRAPYVLVLRIARADATLRGSKAPRERDSTGAGGFIEQVGEDRDLGDEVVVPGRHPSSPPACCLLATKWPFSAALMLGLHKRPWYKSYDCTW